MSSIDYGDGGHLNGRIGLPAAVWQYRSKSVCVGLVWCGYKLNGGFVCDDSGAEGGMRNCDAI